MLCSGDCLAQPEIACKSKRLEYETEDANSSSTSSVYRRHSSELARSKAWLSGQTAHQPPRVPSWGAFRRRPSVRLYRSRRAGIRNPSPKRSPVAGNCDGRKCPIAVTTRFQPKRLNRVVSASGWWLEDRESTPFAKELVSVNGLFMPPYRNIQIYTASRTACRFLLAMEGPVPPSKLS